MTDYYRFPLIQRLNDESFRKRYIEYISYYNATNDLQFMNKTTLSKKKFKCIDNVVHSQKNIKYNFMKLLRWMNTSMMLIGSLNGTYNIIHRTENGFNSYTAVNYYTNGVDHLIRLVYYRGAIITPLRADRKKNLNDRVSITYTRDILDVLFGLYTFEQFIDATGGMTCLIPDILKLVYDYTFMY